MQYSRILLVSVAIALLVTGCGSGGSGGDGSRPSGSGMPTPLNATPADLEHKAFTFADGTAFGRTGEVTLIFGAFMRNIGHFRLESGGSVAPHLSVVTGTNCL